MTISNFEFEIVTKSPDCIYSQDFFVSFFKVELRRNFAYKV